MGPFTLVVDVGGTGIKQLVLDGEGSPINERARELTPHPATPDAVLEVIATMAKSQPAFERISVGFPGVVKHGVVHTAPNLGTEAWAGTNLELVICERVHAPTRALNDADLQGYGVIAGRGVEMVLTLGTGLGAALFVDGRLVPNLELAHHPWKKRRTYEGHVGEVRRKELGKRRWTARVLEMLTQLEPIFNYDAIYLGGGNAERLDGVALPPNAHLFSSRDALRGGARLWGLAG